MLSSTNNGNISFKTLIQDMAKESYHNSKPVDVVYGKVTSTSPLEIWLNQSITLDREHIVLSRCVTDYVREEEVSWSTGSADSHSHPITGIKQVKVLNSLKIGEAVVLIQLQGGQKFLVLDRVVSA